MLVLLPQMMKSGLGLGLDMWCLDFLVEPGKDVEDLPGPSMVEGSVVSTQHAWLWFNQSHSFLT